MTSLHEQIDWAKGDGLVPAVVQNSITGRILMLGYMNAEALTITETSNWVTFFSRSRQKLWTKGEESGNRLQLDSIEIDCDKDTLLIQATPQGPTCHLGTVSCFDQDNEGRGFGFIGHLEEIIDDRAKNPNDGSYTASLLQEGVKRIAQKVGEEGVEVALAAVTENRDELVNEMADLMYHALVLLKHQDIRFAAVAQELRERHDAHRKVAVA